jgi:uncharacterized protein DUF6572
VTVTDPNVIDVVGVDRQTGEVVLTLCDHLDWDDTEGHLIILQEKLNRYVTFVEAGQLAEEYGAAKGRRVRIEVALKYAPSTGGKAFLAQAERIITSAGIGMVWRASPTTS